jgi:tetratricopeptide (TPR) repeat protein
LLRETLDHVQSLPVLILLAARSDQPVVWADHPAVTSLHLLPLTQSESISILDSLLGLHAGGAVLKQRLAERAGGNPLFLGEIVRSLVESGALAEGAQGTLPASHVEALPPTVRAIIEARIDDLELGDKALLHSAAAIGGRFGLRLLSDVLGTDIDDVRLGLSNLQTRGYVRECQIFPEIEYAFLHPLVVEVIYRGLLREQRRKLHSKIYSRLVDRPHTARDVAMAGLAHHAFEAEFWRAAIDCSCAAARTAAGRSAYESAAAHYSKALEALAHLPTDSSTITESIDLRIELRHMLVPLGRFSEIGTTLAQAKVAATGLNDRARLGAVLAYLTAHYLGGGRFDDAVNAGQEALSIAQESANSVLAGSVLFYLVQAHAGRGDYADAAELGRVLVGYPLSDPTDVTMTSLARLWLVWCEAKLGRFDAAAADADEALSVGRSTNDPLALLLAYLGRGLLGVLREQPEDALVWLEIARSMSEQPRLRAWQHAVLSPLGKALTLLGRIEEAIPLLYSAVVGSASARGSGHALRHVYLGEAYLRAGRIEDAAQQAATALQLARANGEKGHQAYALLLSANVAAATCDSRAVIQAEAAIELATARGMLPLGNRAKRTLAGLARERCADRAI